MRRPRSAPLNNQMTIGNWPFKKNEKGEWVHKKTGQVAKTVNLKDWLKDEK